jgi:argininosuccinate lyase
MAKLWQKDYSLNELIEYFTVGEDHILDRNLITADCAGSIAHGTMLAKAGFLTEEEFGSICSELKALIEKADEFTISKSMEDVHTAVENHLTEKLGDAGKKIHLGRSRNDQIIVDVRLFAKGFLLAFKKSVLNLIQALLDFSEKHQDVPLVGRTHMQPAMPSSVGLWAAAYGEELLDCMELIETSFQLNDQSPLGSAASYGVPLPLDRELVAELLGFGKVQNNVLYANNSRGKFESIILQAVHQVALSLTKLAQDVILFSLPEFGYFTLPDALCSGSSIMPQKKNPCGLELVRAKAAVIGGYTDMVINIIKGLPSGYNRDFQETKGPFMKGCDTGIACVEVCTLTIQELIVNTETCVNAFTPEVFATDRAIELVSKGTPFRDAYKEVGLNLDKLESEDPAEAIKKKTHTGTTGNLNLDAIRKGIEKQSKLLDSQAEYFYSKLTELAGTEIQIYRTSF